MKKKQKILGACLTITMIITGCQKEDIMVKSDYNYVDRTVYNIEYQTSGASQAKILAGEEEFDALLDELMQQVITGDTVWFRIIGADNPDTNPQEPIIFRTTSEQEAVHWAHDMGRRGYRVEIVYDSQTRMYICTATFHDNE